MSLKQREIKFQPRVKFNHNSTSTFIFASRCLFLLYAHPFLLTLLISFTLAPDCLRRRRSKPIFTRAQASSSLLHSCVKLVVTGERKKKESGEKKQSKLYQ